jgi:hypothetical protein
MDGSGTGANLPIWRLTEYDVAFDEIVPANWTIERRGGLAVARRASINP